VSKNRAYSGKKGEGLPDYVLASLGSGGGGRGRSLSAKLDLQGKALAANYHNRNAPQGFNGPKRTYRKEVEGGRAKKGQYRSVPGGREVRSVAKGGKRAICQFQIKQKESQEEAGTAS